MDNFKKDSLKLKVTPSTSTYNIITTSETSSETDFNKEQVKTSVLTENESLFVTKVDLSNAIAAQLGPLETRIKDQLDRLLIMTSLEQMLDRVTTKKPQA